MKPTYTVKDAFGCNRTEEMTYKAITPRAKSIHESKLWSKLWKKMQQHICRGYIIYDRQLELPHVLWR